MQLTVPRWVIAILFRLGGLDREFVQLVGVYR